MMAKIMIVDDDPDVIEGCRLVLERAGHEVASALSREEGRPAIETFQPDLLILDVVMAQPDDGFAMAQQLRRHGFEKPILMLSSINKVTGYKYGKNEPMAPVDAFEEKPIRPERLLEQVNLLLGTKED